ncbi:hemagglutinin protein [Flavobacteriales bacterium 33_180_T64]|nr:hemagglutinin protein [Flavobacteriales bacterium 33_180_T64]
MKTKQIQLVLLITLCSIYGHAQSIEKYSIDSGGDATTVGGIEILYTIGEVNVQELNAGGISVSEGFINTNFKVNINPQVFLQGPLLNPMTVGLMNDNLRASSYLPTTSPYADAVTVVSTVFNTGGTSGTGLAQDDIVDWVWLEIRQANDNTKVVRAQSVLLQRDGDIVGLDGISTLKINAAPTNYYVVVKHRNHLGAMTSTVMTLSESSTTSVDFKNNALLTYGSNARVDVGSGVMALWTGSTNDSSQIKFLGAGSSADIIKDYILADLGNFLNFITYSSTAYLNVDVNLDGIGRFSGSGDDSNIIKDNVLQHPANFLNFPTFTINTTVPPEN